MATAHVCARCGSNLAKIRAVIDPHYGLPLIFCPCCESAWVRRRHPLVAAWRTARRIIRALFIMAVQLIICGNLLAFNIAGASRIAFLWRRGGGWQPLLEHHQFDLIVAMVLLPLITGLWLGGTLRHLRLHHLWLLWLAAAVFVVLFALGYDTVATYLRAATPRLPRPDFATLASRGVAMLMILSITFVLTPLGRLLGLAYDHWQRSRTRMLRKRLRRVRSN